MAKVPMNAQNGNTIYIDKKLQSEIFNLIHYIDRLRKEIAGIAQAKNSQTRFEGMADRLDAIIGSTAEATDKILGAMEGIDSAVEALRKHPDAKTIDALCDQIAEKTTVAMEACSFQDLTGQRVSKVIGSLRFVEERVNAMADICGRDEIETLSSSMDYEGDVDKEDDGVALEGPQTPDGAISQADIDALFN
jgi:chemotaxis protein CheZ